MINIKENEKLNTLNHSCAHLLAQAVSHIYPFLGQEDPLEKG